MNKFNKTIELKNKRNQDSKPKYLKTEQELTQRKNDKRGNFWG